MIVNASTTLTPGDTVTVKNFFVEERRTQYSYEAIFFPLEIYEKINIPPNYLSPHKA
jgi:hypothetical protein